METEIIALIVGFLIGLPIGYFRAKKRSATGIQGVLNIDCSISENNPGLWLQLDVPIEDVIAREQSIFIVKVLH